MSKRTLMAASALAFALPLAAQDAAPKAIGAAQKTTITATVEKVDATSRVLTLKGPKGNVVDVEVSTAVKRFPEIKVGDQLTVTYTESLVISVAKAEASTPLGRSVSEALAPAPGSKPAGVAARRIKATVAVDSIDTKAKTMTVHTSDGTTETFPIQDLRNVEGVKPGDKITLDYEEAVAIAVTAPKAKS